MKATCTDFLFDTDVLFEIDCDGVITDMPKVIDKAAKEVWEGYNRSILSNYKMDLLKAMSPKAYDNVMAAFHNPEIMGNMPVYPKAVASLKRLSQFPRSQIRIHTNVMPEIVEARQQHLEEIREKSESNFDIKVACEKEKVPTQACVLIEDCVENLLRSPAPIKILIKQEYNKGEENAIAIAEKSIISYVANDLEDAVDFLETIFMKSSAFCG